MFYSLHNEEFSVLLFSPNISQVIKSIRMRWAGHVPRRGEDRHVLGFGEET